MYEGVRSDRNLYSKNLIDAQDEIAELKKSFRRMTQRISRLKDDIDTKALQIVGEEEKKKNYAKENDVLQKGALLEGHRQDQAQHRVRRDHCHQHQE